MQPKSKITYDKEEKRKLNKTIKNAVETKRRRLKNIEYATSVPEFIALKLSNRCNLRCKHCYQWNEDGYHNFMTAEEQNEDMDIDIIKHVLNETQESKARLYLWGGEPLIHRKFGEIVGLLLEYVREVSICTNGILIDKHLDDLLKISNVEFLIAIEGFQEDHDALRGAGTFDKTMKNIVKLVALKKKGIFKGKITIHTMINDSLVPHLYELLLYLEDLGVDMVMVCYPWYISEETSRKMDSYFQEHFNWLNELDESKKSNWHAFKYRLDKKSIPILRQQVNMINRRTWTIRLRYQPDLRETEMEDFIEGKDKIGTTCPECVGLSTRMDIGPDGGVTACKLFSEFHMGNLNDKKLLEIWNSDEYRKVRKIINLQPMPVCTKCNVLYLHGN